MTTDPRSNYVFALRVAREALAAEPEPRAAADRAGCRFVADASFFEVPFLGRVHRVSYPSGEVRPGEAALGSGADRAAGPSPGAPAGPAATIPGAAATPPPSVSPPPAGEHLLTVSILVLHYLTKARGTPVTGEWIAFRELPGGEIYNTPFTNRTIRPMAGRFGREPGRLVEAGERLGGRRETFGHASTRLDVFPRLPLCFVVWEGDEEIPSSGQILFDRSASDYLDTEDLVVVAAEAFLALRQAVTPGLARPGTLEPS